MNEELNSPSSNIFFKIGLTILVIVSMIIYVVAADLDITTGLILNWYIYFACIIFLFILILPSNESIFLN